MPKKKTVLCANSLMAKIVKQVKVTKKVKFAEVKWNKIG